MAGQALSAAAAQLATTNGYAQSAISAATSAMAALSALEFSTSWTVGGGVTFPTATLPTIGTAPVMVALGSVPPVTPPVSPVVPPAPPIIVPPPPPVVSVVIPPSPAIVIPAGVLPRPQWSIVYPTLPLIQVPDINEDVLTSALRSLLSDNLKGGTGLSPEIEEAIWSRDLERNEQQLVDSTDKTTSLWAKKGFTLPDGFLAHSLSEIQKEYMNKQLDRSREIAIKQADLEQTNLFKTIESTVGLIKTLNDRIIQYQDLVYKSQDSTAKFANEYIDLQIKTYEAQVEICKAYAIQYEAEIKGALAAAEVYKAQVEGQVGVAKVGEAQAMMYKAQVDGSLAQAEVYKAQCQGVVAQAEITKTTIEANKAQIDAWAASANAQVAGYTAQIEAFKAQGMLSVSVADCANKAAEVQVQAAIANSESAARMYQQNERNQEFKASVQMEAAKAVASATASMAAGAMAAAHASATFSYNESQPLVEI